MRRTVKAWCARWDSGTLLVSYTRYTRHLADAVACAAWLARKPKVIPVTITYNDGRPAPKRRKAKGGKRV